MNASVLRRGVQSGAMVLVLVLLAQTFVAIGWLRPVVVSGGSMAPKFCGEHLLVYCDRCGEVAVDAWTTAERCPQCGTPAEFSSIKPGDRLVVSRLREPRRWSPVVLCSPIDARSLLVKRVLGLPGESVSFVGGDLWVNHRRSVKTLDEQLAVRIPLSSGPPTDDLPWNAGLSRPLNRVGDLMATFRASSDSAWRARFDSRCEVVHELGGDVSIRFDSGESLPMPSVRAIGDSAWVISTFDASLLIAVDGRTHLHKPLRAPRKSVESGVEVLGMDGLEPPRELRFWRDVYYEAAPKVWKLGPEEWFVVGDNQAVSVDSRNWDAPPGVPTRLLVGRP